MDATQHEYVRLAVKHLSPAFASVAEVDRILTISRRLPATRSFGLEGRLASGVPQADLLVRFTAHDGSREALRDYLRELLRGRDTAHVHVWQALRELCRLWCEPSHPLQRYVAAVWLELDLFGNAEEHPLPCIFVDFVKRPRVQATALAELLSLIHSAGLPAGFSPNLSRCLEALPASGRIFSIGAMLSRGPGAVRLCLSGVRSVQLPDYLARIGWDGPLHEVKSTLDRLALHVDAIALALDLDERIQPRLGVEMSIEGEWTKRQRRWREFLDLLVHEGLSTPEKRDAMVAWCGYQDARRHGGAWPHRLQAFGAGSGGPALSLFLRKISHVKLVFQPGRPVEAKGYLEFMHLWLQRDPGSGRYFVNEVLM